MTNLARTNVERSQGFTGMSFGVDGCRAGWFWVGLKPDGTILCGVAEKLAELVNCAVDTDRIFVDIPIGLQAETRRCDASARRFLGLPRASSVFPAPAREALGCPDYATASQRNQEETSRKLTKQTFAIIPKIREVDTLLRASRKARRIVREVHPEVCFRGFAGRSMTVNKKKPEGYRERVAVLGRLRPCVEREIEDMVALHRDRGVARDDVVDAMAAVITAASDSSVLRTLPETPEMDSQGLPMEMVYADVCLPGGTGVPRPGKAVIPPEVRRRIRDKLSEIERQESVRILLAVESGSRAWGFPSPDSDFDVRFLYARPRDWYLSIDRRRDVIECPTEDMLDINGWDIRKALGLLMKANPVLSEWLFSPVRYKEDLACTERLRELAARVAFGRPARFHYLHLGRSSYKKDIAARETVPLKKYFYALRPALALRWLRSRPDPPPMDLPGLRAGLRLAPGLDAEFDRLIAAKAEMTELGKGPRIGALDRFIESEFAIAEDSAPPASAADPGLKEDANRVFREIIDDGL
ncbi:MAG: DUF429 domain-containing protein [Rhodobacteraceae bacterium]|nr:DUF429 domain-containing protein [Paracoccaceae bacterium]MCY4141625.1 DUF429 domain-containing protein [Paracoccaceae bacterium]